MGGIDHHRAQVASFVGQCHQHPREHPHPVPADPAIVEGLGRTVGRGGVAPAQAVAVDEDDATENAPVIHPATTARLRKEQRHPSQLRVRQPEEIAHPTPPNHGQRESRLQPLGQSFMGPEPRSM